MSSLRWILPVLFVILPDMSYSDHTECPCEALHGIPRNAHPQIVFNNADWVARVKIIGIFRRQKQVTIDGKNYRDIVYTVKVRRVFKGSKLFWGCKMAILTDIKISPCSVKGLQKNSTYLLAGMYVDGKFWMDQCSSSLIMEWEKVTIHQRISMNRRYAINEECQDKCEMSEAEIPALNSTVQAARRLCYFRFTTCVASTSGNEDCNWIISPSFNQCISEPTST